MSEAAPNILGEIVKIKNRLTMLEANASTPIAGPVQIYQAPGEKHRFQWVVVIPGEEPIYYLTERVARRIAEALNALPNSL